MKKTKTCSKCKTRKDPEKDFPVRKKGSNFLIDSWCLECRRKSQEARRLKASAASA